MCVTSIISHHMHLYFHIHTICHSCHTTCYDTWVALSHPCLPHHTTPQVLQLYFHTHVCHIYQTQHDTCSCTFTPMSTAVASITLHTICSCIHVHITQKIITHVVVLSYPSATPIPQWHILASLHVINYHISYQAHTTDYQMCKWTFFVVRYSLEIWFSKKITPGVQGST